MKQYFIALSLVLFFSVINSSCHKITIASDPNCPLDIDHITGKYKVSSIKIVILGGERDVTNNFDACALDDTMQLLSNKTYNNIDKGTAQTCANDYSGTWDLTDNKLSIDGSQYSVIGFNCNQIALSKDSTGYTFHTYYNKF